MTVGERAAFEFAIALKAFFLKEILNFRSRLQNIISYDWVNVPLVYTQVISQVFLEFYNSFATALSYSILVELKVNPEL